MAYSVMRLNYVDPDPTDAEQMSARYRAGIEIAEYLDTKGLNSVSLDEHHTSTSGWAPTPLMNAGMILACTDHLTVMLMALLLPLHDPIRVAEDVAVIDLVSKGRLVMTVGLGYRPVEYALMGQDWGTRGKRLDESIEVMLKCWTGEPFEHNGEMVQVLPRPYTRPHPMLMVGGSAKASARRAARFGLPFNMNGHLPDIKAFYEQECEDRGIAPFCIAPEAAPQFHVVDDPDKAWAELGECFMTEARIYADWQPPGQHSLVHSGATTVDELRAEGIYRFATPDEAIEQANSAGSIAIHPLCGGMPIDAAWQGIELFADKVLPAIGAKAV